MLIVDDLAKNKIKAMLELQDEPRLGVRLKISGKTLKEYKHELSFVKDGDLKETDSLFESNEIKVYTDQKDWENLKGTKITYVDDLWDGGFKVENPNVPAWGNPKAAEIQDLIENQINPGLAMHGGYVSLVDVRENDVLVNFGGGCQGCGMASVTVKQGVEQMIRNAFPEIERVVDITDHAEGTNPYYQSSGV